MDRKSRLKRILLMTLFLAMAGGLVYFAYFDTPPDSTEQTPDRFPVPVLTELKAVPFVENRSIYSGDHSDSIVYFYITVFPDEPNDPYTSFDKVNNYQFSFETSVEKTVAKAIVQEGDENGPAVGKFGYGEKSPNTTIEVKGRSSSRTAYKSYKLRLTDRNGFWQGQKVINLNKHPFDVTKVRNKLSSDYFKIIPNMVGYRTQFAQVKIKDLTKGADAPFVDYGLFTQTEQINGKYLKTHGLDPNGSLYKANLFEFARYPDAIKTVDDPTYDRDAFNHVLEIQGNEDHNALIAMLDDLNNYAVDIDTVIEKHFNRDNLLTWFATNILFANIDTNNENFFLYKPVNSSKWNMIPWDYDNGWGVQNQAGMDYSASYSPWQNGVQNYWSSTLQNRFLRKEQNRKDLDAKMQELLRIITPDQTRAFLGAYYPVVSRYVSQYPDSVSIGVTMENFAKEYNRLPELPQENYERYKASLEKPMPVYMWTQERREENDVFGWDLSFDAQDETIYYDFYLDEDPAMSSPIIVQKFLKDNEIAVPALRPGTYYWKLVIRDASGNEMTPFDTYKDLSGKPYFGVKEYVVE